MAMDNCAHILVKMQDLKQNGLSILTASYFDTKIKAQLKLLEK